MLVLQLNLSSTLISFALAIGVLILIGLVSNLFYSRSTSLKPIERKFEMQRPLRSPFIFWLLLGLLMFLGVGALGGGAFLMIDPSGASMQWSLEALTGSLFQNYLISGLLLFTVFDVGSVLW